MAHEIVGSIITLVLSGLAFMVFVGMWFVMPNKNNRRDVLAATAGVCFVLAVESGYYLTGENRYIRGDGVCVQWERPIFTGIAGVLLTLAIGLFLAIDYQIYVGLLFKVIAAAVAWGVGYVSGDPSTIPLTWAFWFITSSCIMICAFVVAAWAMRRTKDNLSWLVLVFSAVSVLFYAVAWLLGPAFLNGIKASSEYWLYFIADLALFVVLPVLINIFQGDEDSIAAKAGFRFRNNAPEDQRLMDGYSADA